MFRVGKSEEIMTFTVFRERRRLGDGSRILFWIDRDQRVLQRGRQEQIPLESVSGFGVSRDRAVLFCRLGETDVPLFETVNNDLDKLRGAAKELSEFCGVSVIR